MAEQPVFEPRFQRRLTLLFTCGYFATLVGFIVIAGVLFLVPQTTFSQDVREVMLFLFGLIGPLVGFQTKSLGDQYQYHYGSSVGSKTKDPPQRPAGMSNV
ncbi:MAG: hypothetical protein OEQ39_04205 [Gammaproteobacteria bacterium]|nr:hypothetical protein [Gammaproteobacteria bacterium]MDH3466185.1 hypothetical protein [Gammaproteobacteria bacterium]